MGVNKWWRNRKGSSTMEYIVIIAVGAIFALLLFNVVTDSGIQGMLKEKVIAIIQGIDTPSDNEQIAGSVNDPDNSLKRPVGHDPSDMAPSTDGLIGDSNKSSEKEVHDKDVTNVGRDNNTGPASTTDSEKNESVLTEVGKGVLDFIGYYDAKAAITGVDENGHKISVGERILRGAMLLPVAKPVKGVKLVAKYGDDVLVFTKNKLDDFARSLKKTACACPKKKEKIQVSRKSSLRQIKRELGIPMSQQPIIQKMVPMTDRNGNWILGPDKKPIMTRELTYEVNGKKIVIQDHSAGHQYPGGIGNQGPHHNVRTVNPKTGKTDRNRTPEGAKDHYYFDYRNKK